MKFLVFLLSILFIASCANTPNSSKPDPYLDPNYGKKNRDGIRNVIKANKHHVKACYEQALKDNKHLAGKIILKWGIVGNGVVTNTEVILSTLANDSVENCLSEKLKTFTFPDPGPDKEVVVKFPFLFGTDKKLNTEK